MKTTVSICDICGKHDKPFDRLSGSVIEPIVEALNSLGDDTYCSDIKGPTQDSVISVIVNLARESSIKPPIHEICYSCKIEIKSAIVIKIKELKEAKSQ